jgi:hypothetical protein
MAVTTTKLKEGANEIWKLSGFATSGDASSWIRVPKHSDRNVHALGTFAGSISLQVQGSNEADQDIPTSGIPLRDSNETVIALTAPDLVQILENTEWIRVVATAGTGGANATVYLKFVRRP